MALTPMVFTARYVKRRNRQAKIVFVGPCMAKKGEARRKSIRSMVDYVLTFEEVAAMFDARGIDFDNVDISNETPFTRSSADGRGFAVAGGVAQAVTNYIKSQDPERDVKVVAAEGLENCRQMVKDAARGKYNGYLLEGMACPGGCVAGAGTLLPIKRAAAAVKQYMKGAERGTDTDEKTAQEATILVNQ